MKKSKINKVSLITLMMMLLLSGFSTVKAADCKKCVDIICTSLKDGAKRIKECKSIEDVDNIVNNLTLSTKFDDIEIEDSFDDCGSYVLTSVDKEDLKKAWREIADAMVDVVVVAMGGNEDFRPVIAEQMLPFTSQFDTIVDNSSTLNDFIDTFSKM